MSTRLLISPPAAGKTQLCIDEIRAIQKQYPLSKVRVIVPDRFQASYFRRRLSTSGGGIGAYVGTFNDLYKFILERAGNYIPVASSALLHRLIQDVVDTTPLAYYASLRTQPGYLLALRDAFAELKRALTYPESFIERSKDASIAQRELAHLYNAYQDKLRSMGWADFEGLSWLAVEALENNLGLMDNAIQLLVVDGFDSFIGTQRRILQLLSTSTNLLITLPGDPTSSRTVHRRFAQTFAALQQGLTPETVFSEAKPYLPPDISHVEAQLFENTSLPPKQLGQPFLRELRFPAEEAREALRWIKACIVRENVPLQQCAIFMPSIDQYRSHLRSAAHEFGIPIHFTQTDSLTASPAIAALLNLLTLPVQNFRTNTLFNVLHSPYFSFFLVGEALNQLEQVSRLARIVEGQEQWDETWERLTPSSAQSTSDLDEERILQDLPHGESARALQSQLSEFFIKVMPPEGTRSQTEWTRWLEDLLVELRFQENTSGEWDEMALESFREALRALVMSESIAGVRVVDYPQYLSDLQNTLSGTALLEPTTSGAAVFAGSIREARGLRFQAVALLGLSEGIFPEVERSDPFLPEELRAALGLDSRLEREQVSLFYQAVTRTDTHLLLTRPYLSDDGEPWEASHYWNAVVSLFKKDTVIQKIRPDDSRPLYDAASSQELLFWAVRRKGLPQEFAELAERWSLLQHARDVIRARRAKRASSLYDGASFDLHETLVRRFASDKVWSASRLETYGICPHMFYVKVALDLEKSKPPELGLDVAQIGSILHKILEDVYRTATNPAVVESALARLPEVAREVFSNAPQAYGFRPSDLWELEQEQFLGELENTILALAEDSQGWTPQAFEQTFGIKDTPPLKIDLENGELLLRGVIDRIDCNTDGKLRMVDYKTGSSHLTKDDLINGRRLQLPLYALAARDALHLGTPVEGIYWKIKAAEAGSLKLSKFTTDDGDGLDAAILVAKQHIGRIVKGIRAGDFPPIPPKGGCPEYCPAVQWCWRYQKAGW